MRILTEETIEQKRKSGGIFTHQSSKYSKVNETNRIRARLKEEIEIEDEEDDDGEFGDPDDITLTGNLTKDFNNIVNCLRHTDYKDLGDSLEKIVKDPKLYTLLSKGFGNGELAKVKMSSSIIGIPVTQLLPSQSEIGLGNSLTWPFSGKLGDCSGAFENPANIGPPIITYRKSFIIDGHHRWSEVYALNPQGRIAAINFNYTEQSPFRALRNFQGAVAVANKEVPSSTSKVNNIYAMSKEEIKEWILQNITDKFIQDFIKRGIAQDADGIINYIYKNCLDLKYDNPPWANAPDRELMPQTDEKSIKIAQDGQTNI